MVTKSRFGNTVRVFTCIGVLASVSLGVAPGTQAADVSFDPAVHFDAGNGTRSVSIVDLNNDGSPDIVLANSYDSTVTVRLGDGSGGFGAAAAFEVGGQFPMKVVSADLNEDGQADLVIANYISGDVSILFGNGDGTFQTAIAIPIPYLPPGVASTPMSLAIDDVDNDGNMDVVVANYEGFCISVLAGDGLGGFSAPFSYSVSAPSAIAVGDLNKDGKRDLVAVNVDSSTVYALFGDGFGGFGAPVTIAGGLNHPRSLAVADLNADGNSDIAVASFDDNVVYVLLGNGNGTFQGAVGYPVGSGPHDIVVRDLNGDGKPDIATADSSAYSVSVLLNDGLGGFGSATYFPAVSLPLSLAAADLNGDLKPDIVTANFDSNDAAVLLNTTPFPPMQQITAALEFFDASVAGGTLTGKGPGNSAEGKLNALRDMLAQAGKYIEAGDVADACRQLLDAYRKTDGQAKPPDFVQGPAAGQLAGEILELRAALYCDTK